MRALLLVLFLASTSLYLLGIASLVAASRIASLPTETPRVLTVEQTVIVLATEAAQQATPEPTDTPTEVVVVPVQVLLRNTPTPSGPPTITPTLEATPTQLRSVPRIVAPPEPSVAPARPPIQLSAVVTPGVGTRTGSAQATVVPGLRPVGTAGLRPAGTPDEDVPTLPPTPTVRLGPPIPVGSTPGTSQPVPTNPPAQGTTTSPVAGPGLPPGFSPAGSPTPAPPVAFATPTPAPAVPLKPGPPPPTATVRR